MLVFLCAVTDMIYALFGSVRRVGSTGVSLIYTICLLIAFYYYRRDKRTVFLVSKTFPYLTSLHLQGELIHKQRAGLHNQQKSQTQYGTSDITEKQSHAEHGSS